MNFESRFRAVILGALLIWWHGGTAVTAIAQTAETAQAEACFAAPNHRCAADLAVAAAASSGVPFASAMFQSYAAATLAMAGDAGAADAYAGSAIRLLERISDRSERDIVMTNIVWYQALRDQTVDAAQAARNIQTASIRAMAMAFLAEGQVRRGDRDGARKTLAAVVGMLDRNEEKIADDGFLWASVVYVAALVDDQTTLLRARKLSLAAIGRYGDPYADSVIYATVAAGEAAWGDREAAAKTVILATAQAAKLGKTIEAAECLAYVLAALAEIGEKDPIDKVTKRIVGLVRKEKKVEDRATAFGNLAWALAVAQVNSR